MRRFIFLVLSIFATASHAQQQTIENAQKFLQMTLPGNEYSPGSLLDVTDKVLEQNRNLSVHTDGHGRIVDASSISHCRSKIIFDMSQAKTVIWYGGRFNQTNRPLPYTKLWPDPSHVGLKDGFSWGDDIKEVKAYGTTVHVLFKGISNESTIFLGAENLAKRVAYAMEFLRMSCDSTAATGF